MPEAPTLLAKIKPVIDKNFLKKQWDSLTGVVRVAGGDAKTGSGGVDMIGSMLKPIFMPIKTIVTTLGKIFAAISIAAALLEVLRPVMKAVDAIVKMIGELLRPISDVVMMLLQPLLIMMRPLVQMFRTLMLPFREAATKGMAAASQLIAQGMDVGGEKGRSMILEGAKGALHSASLMMSGFVDVLLSPLKNVEFLGIGSAITAAMDSWISSAVGGVIAVQEKAELVNDIIDIIDHIPAGQLKYQFGVIDQAVKETAKTLDGLSLENLDEATQKVQEKTGEVQTAFVEFYKGVEKGKTETSAFEELAENYFSAVKDIQEILPNANLNLTTFANVIKGLGNEARETALAMAAEDAAKELDKAMRAEKGSLIGGIIAFLQGAATNIQAGGESFVTGRSEWRKYWDLAEAAQEDAGRNMLNEQMKRLEIEEELDRKAWERQVSTMSKYWSNSIIPNQFEKGFKTMTDSATNFKNKLSEISNEINSISRSLQKPKMTTMSVLQSRGALL